MTERNGAMTMPLIGQIVNLKEGVVVPLFKRATTIYQVEIPGYRSPFLRETGNTINFSQGTIIPTFKFATTGMYTNLGSLVVGGASLAKEFFQPRKSPLVWYPEKWNGQRP